MDKYITYIILGLDALNWVLRVIKTFCYFLLVELGGYIIPYWINNSRSCVLQLLSLSFMICCNHIT